MTKDDYEEPQIRCAACGGQDLTVTQQIRCNKCGVTFEGQMSPWGELFLGREFVESRDETGALR